MCKGYSLLLIIWVMSSVFLNYYFQNITCHIIKKDLSVSVNVYISFFLGIFLMKCVKRNNSILENHHRSIRIDELCEMRIWWKKIKIKRSSSSKWWWVMIVWYWVWLKEFLFKELCLKEVRSLEEELTY